MGGNGWIVGPHGGKRKPYRKVRKILVPIRMEESDKLAIERLARLTDRTASDVIREACRVYILTQERAVEKAKREWEESRRQDHPDPQDPSEMVDMTEPTDDCPRR